MTNMSYAFIFINICECMYFVHVCVHVHICVYICVHVYMYGQWPLAMHPLPPSILENLPPISRWWQRNHLQIASNIIAAHRMLTFAKKTIARYQQYHCTFVHQYRSSFSICDDLFFDEGQTIFFFSLSILFHFDRPNIFLHFPSNPSWTRHFPSLKMSIFSLSHLMARVVMITRRRSRWWGTQSKYGKSRSTPPSEEVSIIVCSIRGHIMWKV